ncbi:MAG: pectin acetylesterase-family hydrolase [Myxococcaceae bacterium]
MRRVMSVLLLLAAACGKSGEELPLDDGGTIQLPDGGIFEVGEPISAPAGTWTWVDFPGTKCDDGSPTGLGINVGTSNNVLVFFAGGGACWDYLTCYQYNAAMHGPYGATQFNADLAKLGPGTLVDRTDLSNPFRTWSVVFLPYCTGDLHAGNAVRMYQDRTYHHAGRTNTQAFLSRLLPTFPSAEKIVVAGASAGGGGALFNYAQLKTRWPVTKTYLVDDSLQLLVGDAIPPSLRTSWVTSWSLDLASVCNNCQGDFSLIYSHVAQQYPNDRMALLSFLQDTTTSLFYGFKPLAQFQADLEDLDSAVLVPSQRWKTFFVQAQGHALFASGNAAYSVALKTWLTKMVQDDATWSSELH